MPWPANHPPAAEPPLGQLRAAAAAAPQPQPICRTDGGGHRLCPPGQEGALAGSEGGSGIDCLPSTAFTEMMSTKAAHRKCDGVCFYHFVQSFSDAEGITPPQANQLARGRQNFSRLRVRHRHPQRQRPLPYHRQRYDPRANLLFCPEFKDFRGASSADYIPGLPGRDRARECGQTAEDMKIVRYKTF